MVLVVSSVAALEIVIILEVVEPLAYTEGKRGENLWLLVLGHGGTILKVCWGRMTKATAAGRVMREVINIPYVRGGATCGSDLIDVERIPVYSLRV